MKPQYLKKTFLLDGGFQFTTAPPAGLSDPANLTSSDPWIVLGCALARAQRGDLDAVDVLPDLMANDEGALVWSACVKLIGFAGHQSIILMTARRFLSEPKDAGVQWSVSSLMRNGCSLRFVEPLLHLHDAAAADRSARRHVQHCLSALLEDEPGEIDLGPDESEVPDPEYPEPFTQYLTVVDQAGYVEKVRAASARAARRLASPDQPVTAGMPFDLQALVLRLHQRLRSGAESDARMEWERMCFEAFTGIDCSGFYAEGRLHRLAAMALLEEFLDSRGATRFAAGIRYFFGHPIEP